MSGPALFRLIDLVKPTLLIDEAEGLSNNLDLLAVVNAGYTRPTAWVPRCVGEELEVRRFATFGAKVLALIGTPPETTASRSIVIAMRRKSPRECVERLFDHQLEAVTQPLRRRLARWAADHLEELRHADPEIPNALVNDRDADNWRALYAIADAVGGDWPSRARDASLALTAQGQRLMTDRAAELLGDIREVFRAAKNPSGMASETLTAALIALPDRPWATLYRGRPLTTTGLAKMFKPYDVVPGRFRLRGAKNPVRGYRLAVVRDLFRRWIPKQRGTRHKPNKSGAKSTKPPAGTAVPAKNGDSINENGPVCQVPGDFGGSEEKTQSGPPQPDESKEERLV